MNKNKSNTPWFPRWDSPPGWWDSPLRHLPCLSPLGEITIAEVRYFTQRFFLGYLLKKSWPIKNSCRSYETKTMCKGCLRNPITHSLGVSKRKMGTVYHKKQSKQHIPKIFKYKPILDQNNKTPGNGQQDTNNPVHFTVSQGCLTGRGKDNLVPKEPRHAHSIMFKLTKSRSILFLDEIQRSLHGS